MKPIRKFKGWLIKHGEWLGPLGALIEIIGFVIIVIPVFLALLSIISFEDRLQASLAGITGEPGSIERTYPWWKAVCYPGKDNDPSCKITVPPTDGRYEPSKLVGHKGCIGLAWNLEEDGKLVERTVFAFSDEKDLRFGNGGWVVIICASDGIQLTPELAGRIQKTWNERAYGGVWAHNP